MQFDPTELTMASIPSQYQPAAICLIHHDPAANGH